MRTRIVIVVLLLFLVVMSALILRHLGRTRVVARAVAPNGLEMYLVQRFDSGWFNTSFYFRTPTGQWGWCYYHHEDHYWGAGRVDLDENSKRATILRGDKPVVTFDWETQTYVLLRRNQTNIGAQTWSPAASSPAWWTPDLAGKP